MSVINTELPLISVIIPIYNVEKYLPYCLDNIIHQTYFNLEIILVDDGSQDNSGIICDKYALKDSRIKVIHKENRGVSSARNAGMEVSTGDWIYFIDPDDWIELDTLEIALKKVLHDNSDMCFFDYIEMYRDKVIYKKTFRSSQSLFVDLNNISTLKIFFSGMGSCCMFIIKSSIINRNLKFEEQIKIYEDELFKFQIYGIIKSFSYIQKPLYHYRMISNSATKTYVVNINYPQTTILRYSLMCESYKKFDFPLNTELIINSKLIGDFGQIVNCYFKNNDFISATKYIHDFINKNEFKKALLNFDKKFMGNTSKIYMMFGKPTMDYYCLFIMVYICKN